MVVPVEAAESFTDGWPVLRQILGAADGKLTRHEVEARWPNGSASPGLVMLWRWLERVVTRIMEEAEWYVDAGSSNFSGLYNECKRSVRREHAQVRTSDAHRAAPA